MKTIERPDQRESGASLVLALVFLSFFGLVAVAILGFGDASVRASSGYRTERARNYAVDGALDGAVNWVRSDPTRGRDPAVYNDPCTYQQPAADGGPAVTVICKAENGGGSGVPAQIGAVPQYSILTLGQRADLPRPYNYNTLNLFDDGDKQEYGVRFAPAVGGEVNNLTIQGDVFSNSPIKMQGGGTMQVAGTVTVRGTPDRYCVNVSGCTRLDYGANPGLGTDPAYTPRIKASDNSQWTVRDASIPANCNAAGSPPLVEFEPGVYTDATKLNTLFAHGSCSGASFWFKPGVYYFNFTNTTTSPRCGSAVLDLTSQGSNAHQWCIGAQGANGQHVVGGTPFGWDPAAPPNPQQLALNPTQVGGCALNCFSNTSNALTYGDGATADRSLGGILDNIFSSSITLQKFTQVSEGQYSGNAVVKVRHREDTNAGLNTPTIQVRRRPGKYDIFTTSCGTFPLTKSSSFVEDTIVLPTTCLDTGQEINTLEIAYSVSRPFGQGGTAPVAHLDGIQVSLELPNRPTFPRVVPTATDPGGDCNPDEPGVQFVFGGDSHVYVPAGSLELCAGPDPDNPGGGQQIAVYGVPADGAGVSGLSPEFANPVLRPASASGDYQPSSRLLQIGEPGASEANQKATSSVDGCILIFTCPGSYVNETLNFTNGFSLGTGNLALDKVNIRVAHNEPGSLDALNTDPTQFRISGPGFDCGWQNTTYTVFGIYTEQYDVTACLNSVSRLNNFTVQYRARSSNGGLGGGFTSELDGVEVVVTPKAANTAASQQSNAGQRVLNPLSGCNTALPNYWDGYNYGGSELLEGDRNNTGDCALIKVDSVEALRGRVSIKGTVYAPSAAFDIDDSDVLYPFFGRGLVARHLRLKAFKYRGTTVPVASNVIDTTPADRVVTFYACKTNADCSLDANKAEQLGTATVKFASGSQSPTVQRWAVKNP